MKRKEGNNAKIIHNTYVLYLRNFTTMIISLASARLTLKILGINDYGLNSLVGGIIIMFSFLNLSMGTAVQRFYSIEIGKGRYDNLKKIFGVGMNIHLIIAAISFLLAEVFAVFFLQKLNIPEERLNAAQWIFQFAIAGYILSVINVPYSACLRAREDFSRMAYVEIIQAILKLVVLFLLFHINYDKIVILNAFYCGIGLLYFIAIILLAKKYKETEFHINKDIKLLKEMLNFAVLILVAVFARIIRDQGVIILINIFFGLAINAAYAIALQIRQAIENFTSGFKQAVVPQLMSSFGASDQNRMHKLIFTSTKITFILLLIISLPVIFEVDYILKLWLEEPPQYSGMFIILVIIDLIINSFPYFLTQGIHATGRLKKIQTYSSALLILNIVVVYVFLKIGCNFYYAIYIAIITSLLSNIVNVYLSTQILNIKLNSFIFDVIVRCFGIVAITVLILIGIKAIFDESLLRLIIITVSSCLLLFGFGYIIGLEKDEKTFVLKHIKVFTHW